MPPKRTLLLFSTIVAIVYAAWMIRSGVRLAVDTPTYSHWADQLIEQHFNFFAYLRHQDFVAPPVFYLLWITVVAGLKTVLGSSWITGVLVVNWLSLSVGAYAIISAVRRLTQSSASMLLATLLLLVAGDLLIFAPFVLSDLMFLGLTTGVLVCGVIVAATDDDLRTRGKLVAAGTVMVVAAAMFRPVAMPLVVFWIIALGALAARPLVDRSATPLMVLGVVLAFVGILAHGYLLFRPSAWPIGSYPAVMTLVAGDYRAGMFVHQSSPPMLVEPATDLVGVVRITLEKLLFFITPWLPHYSAAHTVINLLFFIPAYALAVAAISNVRRLSPPQRRAVVLLALFALSVAVFHAMLIVDSDQRYRLPVLPAIIMLAAIGLESVRRPRTLASTALGK